MREIFFIPGKAGDLNEPWSQYIPSFPLPPKFVAVDQATETDSVLGITWAPHNRFVAQTTETDSVLAITSRKIVAVAQVTETDLAQAVTMARGISVAQVTETDTSQVIAEIRRYNVAQDTETDASQAIKAVRYHAVGQATETDTSQALTVVRKFAVAQATETDLSQAVGKQKTKAVSQATETDLSQAIGAEEFHPVGQSSETDSALGVTRIKRLAVAQATESDTSQATTRVKNKAVAQSTETDLSQSVTWKLVRLVAQATETDESRSISSVRGAVSVDEVTETDTSQAVTSIKRMAVAQVTETETAQAITVVKRKALPQASESDLAQIITLTNALLIIQATENDLSQPITAKKQRTVSQVTETDTATGLAGSQTIVPVSGPSETDQALPITAVLRSRPTGAPKTYRIVRSFTKTDPVDARVFAGLTPPVLSTRYVVNRQGKIATADVPPNLITNPSFDLNSDGWVGIGGVSVQRDTVDYHSSPASLQISSSPSLPAVLHDGEYPIMLKAGTQYKLSFWAKSKDLFFAITVFPDTVAGVNCDLVFYDWTKFEFYFTSEGVYDAIKFNCQSSGLFFNIDDLQLTEIVPTPSIIAPVVPKKTFRIVRSW